MSSEISILVDASELWNFKQEDRFDASERKTRGMNVQTLNLEDECKACQDCAGKKESTCI